MNLILEIKMKRKKSEIFFRHLIHLSPDHKTMTKTFNVTKTQLKELVEKEVEKAIGEITKCVMNQLSSTATIEKKTIPKKTAAKKTPAKSKSSNAPDVGKMKLADLKEYVEEHDVELPEEGSGKDGKLILKDYRDAIKEFVKNSDSEEEDDSEDKPKGKAAKPKPKGKGKKKASSSSSSSSSSEEESSEEEPKPKGKAKAASKPKGKAKVVPSSSSEESSVSEDDSSSEEKPKAKPKGKAKAASKPKGKAKAAAKPKGKKEPKPLTLSKSKEYGFLMDEDNVIYDPDTKSAIAMLNLNKKGELIKEGYKCLTQAKTKELQRNKVKVWHIDEMGRELKEVATLEEIAEFYPEEESDSSEESESLIASSEEEESDESLEVDSSDEEDEDGSEESDSSEEGTSTEEDVVEQTKKSLNKTVKDTKTKVTEEQYKKWMTYLSKTSKPGKSLVQAAKESGLPKPVVSDIFKNNDELKVLYPKVFAQLGKKAPAKAAVKGKGKKKNII